MVSNYDVELAEMRLDIDEEHRDNAETLRDSIDRIQVILNDINKRLEALE